MAYAHVQSKIISASAVTTLTAAFASNVTTGNRIVAGKIGSTGAITATCADNASGGTNTYTKDLDFDDANNFRDSQFSAPIQRGGGSAVTVTITLSAGDNADGFMSEYSGLDSSVGAGAVDTSGHNFVNGTATSFTMSASPNPGVANEGSIGFVDCLAANAYTATSGTIRVQSAAVNGQAALLDIASVTGTTTLSGTMTADGGAYHAMLVVYKLASGAVTIVPPAPRQPTPAYPTADAQLQNNDAWIAVTVAATRLIPAPVTGEWWPAPPAVGAGAQPIHREAPWMQQVILATRFPAPVTTQWWPTPPAVGAGYQPIHREAPWMQQIILATRFPAPATTQWWPTPPAVGAGAQPGISIATYGEVALTARAVSANQQYEPVPGAPGAGTQPLLHAAFIADQGQPIIAALIPQPRAQPLPMPPIMLPQLAPRIAWAVESSTLLFSGSGQSVVGLRPRTAAQPPVDVAAAAVATPTTILLFSDSAQSLRGLRPSAPAQVDASSAFAAASQPPPQPDFRWVPTPQPAPAAPTSGPQFAPRIALIADQGQFTDFAGGPPSVVVYGVPAWPRSERYLAAVPAANPAQASPEFRWALWPQPTPPPPSAAAQPVVDIATLAQSFEGDFPSTRVSIIIMPRWDWPQPAGRAAALADQGQPTAPSFILPTRAQPVPPPPTAAAQPLFEAAIIVDAGQFLFVPRAARPLPRVEPATAGVQPLVTAALVNDQGQPVIFTFVPRVFTPPVPPTAVAGAQPAYEAALIVDQGQFLFVPRAARPLPRAEAPTAGAQPLVAAAIISDQGQPVIFTFVPQAMAQPTPTAAAAGAQPLVDIATLSGAVFGAFVWRPWPQPVPPSATSGAQPRRLAGPLGTTFAPPFAWRGQGPQPVPPLAVAGAQPEATLWGILGLRIAGLGQILILTAYNNALRTHMAYRTAEITATAGYESAIDIRPEYGAVR